MQHKHINGDAATAELVGVFVARFSSTYARGQVAELQGKLSKAEAARAEAAAQGQAASAAEADKGRVRGQLEVAQARSCVFCTCRLMAAGVWGGAGRCGCVVAP